MLHKMNIIEKIEANKQQILPELYEWAETFDWKLDEDGERTLVPYNYVFRLAERLDKNICNKKDYEDILFQIGQINYNETRIKL